MRKSNFKVETTDEELSKSEAKKINEIREQQSLIFGADALLPQRSLEKELEIRYLNNGTSFTLRQVNQLINDLANDSLDPMFPNKLPFFKYIYALNKWDHLDYKAFIKPSIVATWIKHYIYGRFDKEILPALLNKENPLIQGYIKKYKLYHFLNNEGLLLLETYINNMIELMKECLDKGLTWHEFELTYSKKYKLSVQLKMKLNTSN